MGIRAEPLLRTTRGVHVVVPRRRLGHSHAIIFTRAIDGRVMFLLLGDWTRIGTTETDTRILDGVATSRKSSTCSISQRPLSGGTAHAQDVAASRGFVLLANPAIPASDVSRAPQSEPRRSLSPEASHHLAADGLAAD
jgi:hypothetical protein